jgi:hypothetical protein
MHVGKNSDDHPEVQSKAFDASAPVRWRRQSRSQVELKADLAGAGGLRATVHVIRASHTRHGPREEWGPIQWAQAAIIAIYRGSIPASINKARLHQAVNVWLENNKPDYSQTDDWLPRSTVVRALKELRRL